LQNTSPKHKQISIKTSAKTSNPQVFKKPATAQKKQAQICGKTAKLATLELLTATLLPANCITIILAECPPNLNNNHAKQCFTSKNSFPRY